MKTSIQREIFFKNPFPSRGRGLLYLLLEEGGFFWMADFHLEFFKGNRRMESCHGEDTPQRSDGRYRRRRYCTALG